MPSWAVQIVLAMIPYMAKWVDKLFSSKHTPTFRKANKIGSDWTVERIASFGKKKGWVK